MKNHYRFLSLELLLIIIFLITSAYTYAQFRTSAPPSPGSYFWKKVQFGGGIGLSVGSGFTDITLAPNAIYNFNDYVSFGAGLQGSFVALKDNYSSAIYGASLITLFNPIEVVQLSVELEEVRVNQTINQNTDNNIKNNFWNTGLFFGAGYRVENVTIGARYNVLFNKNDFVYSEAFMPFVRVYF